jgi:hypothetical protein
MVCVCVCERERETERERDRETETERQRGVGGEVNFGCCFSGALHFVLLEGFSMGLAI